MVLSVPSVTTFSSDSGNFDLFIFILQDSDFYILLIVTKQLLDLIFLLFFYTLFCFNCSNFFLFPVFQVLLGGSRQVQIKGFHPFFLSPWKLLQVFVCLCFCLSETESHLVALRLASVLSCLALLNEGISGIHFHAWLALFSIQQ